MNDIELLFTASCVIIHIHLNKEIIMNASQKIQQVIAGKKLREEYLEHFNDAQLDEVVHLDYTRIELTAAFSLIQDKENYKAPINSTIEDVLFPICDAACVFFTSGRLTKVSSLPNDRILVHSEGYYHHCGA